MHDLRCEEIINFELDCARLKGSEEFDDVAFELEPMRFLGR